MRTDDKVLANYLKMSEKLVQEARALASIVRIIERERQTSKPDENIRKAILGAIRSTERADMHYAVAIYQRFLNGTLEAEDTTE